MVEFGFGERGFLSRGLDFDQTAGTSFSVWAPNAQRVSVVGDFNGWDGRCHAMRLLGGSGIWEIFIPGVKEGALYKFEIRNAQGQISLKTDPYGFFFEAIGFIPSSLILLLFLMFFIDPVAWWLALPVSFGAVLGIWWAMTKWLKIQLPTGILGGWLLN